MRLHGAGRGRAACGRRPRRGGRARVCRRALYLPEMRTQPARRGKHGGKAAVPAAPLEERLNFRAGAPGPGRQAQTHLCALQAGGISKNKKSPLPAGVRAAYMPDLAMHTAL